MALDKETQQLLHKVSSLKRIVETEEWKSFRSELFGTLATMIDIRNIKPEDASFQVPVRQEVFRIINEWVISAEANAQIQLTIPTEPDHIHREY